MPQTFADEIFTMPEAAPTPEELALQQERELLPLALSDQDGADEAFGQILARHLPKMRQQAMHFFKNPYDADDAVQSAAMKAWEHRDKFQDLGRGMGPWLGTITARTCLTNNRSTTRHDRGRVSFYSDESRPITDTTPSTALSPEDRVVANDHAILEQMLHEMNPDQARVIIDCAINDEPNLAYAVRAGVQAKTVATRAFRGTTSLLARAGIEKKKKGAYTPEDVAKMAAYLTGETVEVV